MIHKTRIILILKRIPSPKNENPSPVYEAHGMDGVEGEDDLGAVELGPFLGHVVVGH